MTDLGRRRMAVLHVGMGKTGTSTVQFFLRDNREPLAELGVLYPRTPGRGRHHRLGLAVKSAAELQRSPEWPREKQAEPARFRAWFRDRLFAEIEESGLPRVLFSDEILFGRSHPELLRLHRLMDRIAEDLRVVVYLRRQDDHMVSRYQQGVKTGWVTRLSEWAREDMSDLYDYRARLLLHGRLLAPRELVVRPFEHGAFVGGSLVQDFLTAADIDVRAEDLRQVEDRNPSLDADSVEFLRLLNLYRVQHEAAVPGMIDNRQLGLRLSEASTGPVLTLPASELDRFMARWSDSNSAVARDFLGDPSGRLFASPRKTANTTTEQRLDPARLDHFFTLLELPERAHEPLRRIAEREARSR